MKARQQKRTATAFRIHEQYSKDTMINDVGLITHAPFEINDYVKPLPLPARRDREWIKEGTKLKICGWGETKFPGDGMAETLHCVGQGLILSLELELVVPIWSYNLKAIY